MELRQLRTFVAVAEESSFTRAADRLHVVQSAVSAGIRTLERELGVSLFDRSTHQVRLSEAGRALLPEARATLAAATAAREAVDRVRGGLSGTVVLGTMQAQAMRAISLPRLLGEFRTEHPGVTVMLRNAGSSELGNGVRDGRLDLAFVALPGRRWPGVRLSPISDEPIMVAVAAGHRLAGRAGVELADLAGETFADLPQGWGTRMAVDRAFASAGVSREIAYEVNDTSALIDFIRQGLAIGLMPASFIASDGRIATVPIRRHVPQFHISLATPGNRAASGAAQALADAIERRVHRG